ncbi:hypothetical protein E2C01_060135 [Portunus trituberculatus]|uniref:Uncharacterized protein n=1 Tax=Portunus trituberculatus TaxID=210409 RepID=A0A5B7H4G4_PORTR|nr:hypothetical protein [Portunus trituberculatus]
MPDTSTCPRINSEGERLKCLAWKNHDYRYDPHLSAHLWEKEVLGMRFPLIFLSSDTIIYHTYIILMSELGNIRGNLMARTSLSQRTLVREDVPTLTQCMCFSV